MASAFLSSSFAFSAYETLKTHSVCSNLRQFGQCVSRNKASDFILIPQVSIPRRLKTSSDGFNLQQPGLSTVWRNMTSLNASAYRLNAVSASSESPEDPDNVPMPIIAIVQDFDYDVTFVKLSFGDRLGELTDTIKAIAGLDRLTIYKGPVSTEGSPKKTTYLLLAKNGHKVEDPDVLERIRLTIIINLLKYHPESCERLAMGEVFGERPLKTKHSVDIAAVVCVNEDGPFRSLLYIEMADRPGLLIEIIELIGHLSFDVRTAEIVTEGFLAKFKFHVSYKGRSLNSRMKPVLENCLRFYIRTPETNEDSY